MRPIQRAVVVQEDAVADDQVLVQQPLVIQPFDGRAAVAARHLGEFHHALRGMDLHRDAQPARSRLRFLQPFGRARVHLRRAQHGAQAAAGMVDGAVHHIQRGFERFDGAGFVPGVFHRMAVGRAPGGRTEHGAQHAADAGAGHHIGPARARQGHVHEGRHAGQQHLGYGDLVGVLRGFDAHAKDGHVFVQRALAQLVAAQLFQQAAIAGFRRRMGVHVDQPRHRHQAVARHDAVGGPRITGACVDDGRRPMPPAWTGS
ncbi:hypothetical protein G6F23_013469 [Rhizopus arrhizus]|nr:hypothetical protein G6F23_013469 [Rhizopus arrhizus]